MRGVVAFPIVILGSMIATSSLSEETRSHIESSEASKPADTTTSQAPWLDTGHRIIVSRADSIAEWMNNFFGDVRTEEEAPYSTLRLRVDQEWDQNSQFDSDIKLRGKVYLPKLNDRISLLFSDEDSGKTGRDDLLIDQRDTPDDVSLQYKARDKERYRIDYRLGLRSSLHPKASVRYLYRYPFATTLLGTVSEELGYFGDDGFGSRSRLEIDKILSEDKLLQWHNKLDWSEEISGFSWNTSLSLDKRLSEKSAFSYFVASNGVTQPDNLVESYGLGVRYRQRIHSHWLFAEVQPGYHWSKPHADIGRDGAAVILFRLEALFQRDFSD